MPAASENPPQDADLVTNIPSTQALVPTSGLTIFELAASPSTESFATGARFMEYYRRNLAGFMVWLDSEENDYRKQVIPLAEHQPAIGFAILAFVAQHGSMSCSNKAIAAMAEDARDKCLQLIKLRAQQMTDKLMKGSELDDHSDAVDAEWMLASILIMTNYDRCCPEVADEHRRAARTIVNLFNSSSAIEERQLFSFLRNQLAIDDVTTASTSFDRSLINNAIKPVPGSDSLLFSRYLTFLHRITLASVEVVETGSSSEFPQHSRTTNMIRSEFEQARGSTLMAAGRLGLNGSMMTRDFVRLVEVYHNAGLMYSFQCLECVHEDGSERTTACNNLFDQLTGFEDQTAFIQNLAWPTFIAGTACHGDKERQKTILALFTSIHQATRFNHYRDAVNFLAEFWAGSDADWRPLARAKEASGKRILVV
ncbi:hypothetical protein GCG54_00008157 [Colletotrichum gloeosporioides]|uniref:Uncharacterized protein n=1 Tax=Colletotrichum gloeosporioides TaxID=474922 RepID=A0A8H4FEQ9_COLGL|nr:uncharacterized protein GCG54_00008157 [Colletotrichum gloeosporioides]KAF3798274.1 hypothetical protein GCG54_00008157 [Colletotrichum gloeosporioides]